MKLSELKRVVTGTRDGVAALTVLLPGRVIKLPQSDDDHWAVCHWVSNHPQRIDAEDISETWQNTLPPHLGNAFRSFQFAPAGQPGCSGEFHTSHAVDYVTIISGKIWLILKNGEIELNPGDTVILRGVDRRWENRGNEPCFATSVTISAQPVGRQPADH